MENLAGLIFWVVFLVSMAVIWWFIVKRTGYHPALGILMLIPIANIVLMLFLAFREWPVQREIKALKTGAPASAKPMSPVLIIVLIIAGALPILMILAAIAIPNLLMAKFSANEAYAKSSLQNIVTAVESYNADKGRYPASEYELKDGNYISEYFDNVTNQGYTFSMNLGNESYRISAAPVACGQTGRRIYSATNSEGLTERDCRTP